MSPAGPVATFLAADHDRLDGLLRRALQRPGEVDRESYDAFRAGLLRHIALEEKILLPAARTARQPHAIVSPRATSVWCCSTSPCPTFPAKSSWG